ncbi:MAG: hypothetical protein M5U31_13155 [Acidimicrobiia bacterium]|nr:hypothetical protein [Acidimicrobiia bacterium]
MGQESDTLQRDPRPAARDRVFLQLRRPLVAGLLLFLVYLAASLATNPGGSLGSDVGAKVATLKVAEENGGGDLDVGYWAEDVDPEGVLHPLYQSNRVGDRWIAVTTLPMLAAAVPLWLLGGYRAVVLLAMAGSVAAAFAARAIARRLGARDGWSAYWLVGLASPVAIYALVFWEHSTGVALLAWAVVLLLDVLHGKAGWRTACGAGALIGLAATMRTEALLYGAVVVAAVLLRLLVFDGPYRESLFVRFRRTVGFGIAAALGVALLLAANELLERAWLGGPLRSTRAVGTAESSGVHLGARVDEAYRTLLGVNQVAEPARDALIGLLILVPLLIGGIALSRRRERLLPVAMVLASWALFLVVFRNGPGFLPGLFAASPLAVFGLVAMWRSADRRTLGIAALVAVPGVVYFGYVGGGIPQWGGRYLLLSGFLLLVLATLDLPKLDALGATLLIVPAVAVTIFGFVWTVQRSHTLAEFGELVAARPEPVVVTTSAFQFRETAAFYEDGRYLALPLRSQLPVLENALERLGVEEFALLEPEDPDEEPIGAIGPYEPTTTDVEEFLPGVDYRIVHYELTT